MEIHKYMYLKEFAIFIKNICCDIYIQTFESSFTNCLWFANFTAFVCGILRLPWCKMIYKFIFFNRELSVANQLSPSFSANCKNARAPLSGSAANASQYQHHLEKWSEFDGLNQVSCFKITS